MKYEEIVKKVKTALAKADASKVEGHVAVQVDVRGEGEGAFYIEVADGKVAVEPYEYKDNDAKVITSADDIVAIAAGKLGIEEAVAAGKIQVEGDACKALVLKDIIAKKAPAKKAAAKPAAKKAPAKKTTTVKAVAAKPAAEKKPAAKTATAKKPAAKKATTAKKPAAK